MRNLLVIGSLNMDMVIHTERVPLAGETVMGNLHAYIPGGKGANQACAGGKLLGGVAMLGKVGRDNFGAALLESLSSCGVDTSLVRQAGDTTGLAVIYVEKSGDNNIMVVPGANEFCDVDFIRQNEQAIAQSKVVMLQMEIPHDAVYEAIRIARRHGRIIVLNPAPAPDGIPDDVLRMVDYLTPNEKELAILSGMPVRNEKDAAAAARALLSRGACHVLATLGTRGALYAGEGVEQVFPAHLVSAVDTTAAGDIFNAAFAVEIAKDMPYAEAVRFANAAAAISVTRNGAQTSIPSRKEVLDLLKKEAVV